MDLGPFSVIGGVPIAAVVLVFGLLVGSFLNVVIARLPYEDQSIVTPRSRCPKCETPIAAWWNIPVLSWIVLRGKCATCKAPIDLRYPMVELLTGLLFVACFARYGLTLAFLSALILTGSLIAITFIDIDLWEIPDQISIPGILIGVVLRPLAFDVPIWSGLAGAAAGAAMFMAIRVGYQFLRGREGMGLGDVKLIAMIGAFLGPRALLPSILVASFAGAIVGIVLKIVAKPEPATDTAAADTAPAADTTTAADTAAADAGSEADAEANSESAPEDGDDDEFWTPPPDAVPFGPFLALGAIAQLLFGPTFQKFLFGIGLFSS